MGGHASYSGSGIHMKPNFPYPACGPMAITPSVIVDGLRRGAFQGDQLKQTH
jgi:hypothetical protein